MPWRLKTSSIDVEVSYKKCPNKLRESLREPNIKLRTETGELITPLRVVATSKYQWQNKELKAEIKLVDPETNKEIPLAEALEVLGHYKEKLVTESGRIVDPDNEEIYHYQVLEDDSESPVKPFKPFNLFDIPEENWVPSVIIESFDILSTYELFSERPIIQRQLFEEAEKRLKQDKIGICAWSFGKFKQCYAFVCPTVREGKFVWVVKFADYQPELVHLMDIPAKVTIPFKEAPTLKTLPPVQALVIEVQQAKKKK